MAVWTKILGTYICTNIKNLQFFANYTFRMDFFFGKICIKSSDSMDFQILCLWSMNNESNVSRKNLVWNFLIPKAWQILKFFRSINSWYCQEVLLPVRIYCYKHNGKLLVSFQIIIKYRYTEKVLFHQMSHQAHSFIVQRAAKNWNTFFDFGGICITLPSVQFIILAWKIHII